MLMRIAGILSLTMAMQMAALAQEPPMGPLRADQATFLALYKELVETNTTYSSSSCTLLAARIAVHLRAAGFEERDITLFSEKLVAKYFPDVPLVPTMSTGATDGIFLEAIGIPVYGVPGGWGDPDDNGVHGLNERRSVRAVFVGRDFLTDLIKVYADAN